MGTIDILSLGMALAVGLGIGLGHFGGLWATVRHLPTARLPGLFIIGSAAARIGLSVLGFYLAMRAGWAYLLVCLGGFLAVRTLLIRRWRSARTQLSA
jgi:F1F0 ATPase subunit 2